MLGWRQDTLDGSPGESKHVLGIEPPTFLLEADTQRTESLSRHLSNWTEPPVKSIVIMKAAWRNPSSIPPSIPPSLMFGSPQGDATPPDGELVFTSRRNMRLKLYGACTPQPCRLFRLYPPGGFGIIVFAQLQALDEAPLHHSPA